MDMTSSREPPIRRYLRQTTASRLTTAPDSEAAQEKFVQYFNDEQVPLEDRPESAIPKTDDENEAEEDGDSKKKGKSSKSEEAEVKKSARAKKGAKKVIPLAPSLDTLSRCIESDFILRIFFL
jgi:cytoskeletal protein RodZ